MKRILIIEYDCAIAELERDYLQVNGFECEIADHGLKGLHLARENDYSLIIIDIMLPGMDGFEVCQKIRENKQVPIIFLSAKSEDIDKIKGLGLGADDYITKPFSPNELVARVKAHIMRHEQLSGNESRNNMIAFDNVIIDIDAHRVTMNNAELSLTSKEYDLLIFFAKNSNKVWSKEALFDKLWGLDAVGDISTVTVHIQRLRDKLEQSGKKHIETVWGVGYRFNM